MEEKLKIYAEIILKKCLQLDKNQPLVIIGSYQSYEFIRILSDIAISYGVRDIKFKLSDSYIKKSMYENYTVEELKEHEYFKEQVLNEYAKKGAAFLMLSYEYPNQMKDIDKNKLSAMRIFGSENSIYFNECRDKNELAWCIACVPNIEWANQVYPNDKNSLDKLWNDIFDMCLVNEQNPLDSLDKNIKDKELICNKLNELKIKQLHLTNSKGTDIKMDLFQETIWCSGITTLKNKKKVLVNYPSVEVFTSPNKTTVNGIVYSTMPLLTSGVIINDFSLKIENGRITEVKAKEHQELLEKLINDQENADYIGEIALVPYNSEIRSIETLFYTTLLDENAACHMAFGDSFTECYKDAENMTEEERSNIGLNVSKTHIDFMFGSKDLQITAITFDNKEINIFKDGNYTSEII